MPLQNEDERFAALKQLDLLNTSPSEYLDRVTRLAGHIFGLSTAAISLIDHDRQWFKSRVGLVHEDIPNEKSPCAAVTACARILVVTDLTQHDIFAEGVLVSQGFRFYAGAPLITRDGLALGALCVLGTEPRDATQQEISALVDLAEMAMSQIALQHVYRCLDPYSGLPNRTQFLEDLDDLGRKMPGQQRVAVMVDLARMDQLENGIQVLGSTYIDKIIGVGIQVINETLAPGRTIYHVASTKLVFLAPVDADLSLYLPYLAQTLKSIQEDSELKFSATFAIGVASFVAAPNSAGSVLRMAYSALFDSRKSESLVALYSDVTDGLCCRRYRILNDFGRALDCDGQLRIVFQPRIDLSTGMCVGAEALLRWNHPEFGEISPAEFIPIIEQTSLAGPTTMWVLDRVLRQLATWQSDGLNTEVSVNISAVDLEDRHFAIKVQQILLRHRIRPEMLELEITESAVMENAPKALAQLVAIEALGIRLAIDDFGTGYSSLAYLQRLPVHVVKIDQYFIRQMAQGHGGQTLVRSMLALCHDLGYRVVAEGVETSAEVEMLSQMQCEEAQGYLFSRPLEVEAFAIWYKLFQDMRSSFLPTPSMTSAG